MDIKKTPVETGAVPKLTAYELATNIMEKPISFQLQKNKNLDNLWLYSKKAIFLPRLLPLLLQLPSISKTAFSIIISSNIATHAANAGAIIFAVICFRLRLQPLHFLCQKFTADLICALLKRNL